MGLDEDVNNSICVVIALINHLRIMFKYPCHGKLATLFVFLIEPEKRGAIICPEILLKAVCMHMCTSECVLVS